MPAVYGGPAAVQRRDAARDGGVLGEVAPVVVLLVRERIPVFPSPPCRATARPRARARARAADAAAAAASILGDLSFASADSSRRPGAGERPRRHGDGANREDDDHNLEGGGEDDDDDEEGTRGSGRERRQAAAAARRADNDLQALIQEKERELQEMNEFRLRSLEQTLRGKDDMVRSLEDKLAKLSEDFHYNLELIANRDAELDRYDEAFAKVKEVLREKEAEASDLRIQIDELEAQIEVANARAQETEEAHQRRLADLRTNMDGARVALENRFHKERLALEHVNSQLEQRLRDKEDDLEAQRREMASTYDELSRQRYRDYEHRIDELQRAQDELHARSRDQTAATERERAARNAAQKHAAELQTKLDASEKCCKQLTWELKDSQQLKDARIAELETEVADLKDLKQSILDDHETKMTDLLSSLHAVEQAFVQQKEHYEAQLQHEAQKLDDALRSQTSGLTDRLSALANKLRAAEDQLEASRADYAAAKGDYEDQLKVKDREMETLRSDLVSGTSRQDAQIVDLRQNLAERDARVRSLEAQLERAAKKIEEADARVAAARQQTEQARAAAAETQRELAALQAGEQSGFSALQAQRDELREANQAQTARIASLEATVTELRAQVTAVQGELRAELWKSSSTSKPAASRGGGGGGGGGGGHVSPIFEGDLGPPSPLSSMTANSATEDRAELGRLQALNAGLEREKDALAAALRAMRAEMETLTDQLHQAHSDEAHESGRDEESAKRDNLRPGAFSSRENDLLHEQAQALHAYIAHLQGAADPGPRGRAETDRTQTTETGILRRLVRTQAHQIDLLRTEARIAPQAGGLEARQQHEWQLSQSRPDVAPSPAHEARVEAIQAENERLQRELDQARRNLVRAEDERDRLADLANKLRAELKHAPGAGVTREQLDQVEKQVATTFESKIRSVELALEQLVMQNRKLKQEVRAARTQDQTLAIRDVGPFAESESERKPVSPRKQGPATSPSASLRIVGGPARASYSPAASRAATTATTTTVASAARTRPSFARDRLADARRRLEQARSGEDAEMTSSGGARPPAAPAATAASRRERRPVTGPGRGQVQIGSHRIRNYNVRDSEEASGTSSALFDDGAT